MKCFVCKFYLEDVGQAVHTALKVIKFKVVCLPGVVKFHIL